MSVKQEEIVIKKTVFGIYCNHCNKRITEVDGRLQVFNLDAGFTEFDFKFMGMEFYGKGHFCEDCMSEIKADLQEKMKEWIRDSGFDIEKS